MTEEIRSNEDPVRREPAENDFSHRIELGRLALYHRYPRRYIERRTEELELVTDHHYRVTVSQQFKVPYHDTRSANETDLLIPLGRFRKGRLPDLKVMGPDGARLAIVPSKERAKIVAVLFTSGWQRHFMKDVPQAQRDDALAVWDLIQRFVAGVAIELPEPAWERIRALDTALRRMLISGSLPKDVRSAVQSLTQTTAFWTDLQVLADVTPLVGRMRGRPGQTYVVTLTYTEAFDYADQLPPEERPRSWLFYRWRWLLARLGLISDAIWREVANLGQSQSIWVLSSLPEGAEAIRYFWYDRADLPSDPDSRSVDIDRAVAGRHASEEMATELSEGALVLDVQLSPSASVVMSFGLVLFTLVVASYIYKRVPELANHYDVRTSIIALASIFSAIPATLTGALAYRGQAFVRRMSRGPRVLLALLSAQAALLAATISLKDLGRFVEWEAYTLSCYAFFLAGLLALIQWGPRWRKTDRTRFRRRTAVRTPEECRRKQRHTATFALISLAVSSLVFAKVQHHMHYDHIFTRDFPENIIDAIY